VTLPPALLGQNAGMAWLERCRVETRLKFVVDALKGRLKFATLCREYGVPRKTGYKWLARYRERGFVGLEDMSRRPLRSPLEVSGDVVAEVVFLRRTHPTWGPKKLSLLLREELKGDAPSLRTVARILERSGLVKRKRHRRTGGLPDPGRPGVQVQKPNDLWTIDFKGWWLASNGDRCEPLTVRDAYSRFILGVVVLPGTSLNPVRRVLEQLFSKYGLPRAIQSDNGTPFVAAHGGLGLTQLSAWWLRLGIEVVRSRPATPSDNGGHERMHRDIAAELESFAALDRRRQQSECDRWRHDFNHHRPHEALKMKVPASVYRRSPRRLPTEREPLTYARNLLVRKVSNVGYICHRLRRVFISAALAGEQVGLKYRRSGGYELWFAHKRLGIVDFSGPKPMLRPTTWNSRRVSPTP